MSSVFDDYYIGQQNGIQDRGITSKLSDLWTGAKTTVSGWFGKSEQEVTDSYAQGVNMDFSYYPYPPSNAATKAITNLDRVATQAAKDPSGQSSGGECSWFNVVCRAKSSVSSVTANAGEFVSSTLTKVIVILVIVAIVGLFLFTYIQAKGAQLAGVK